MRGHAMQDEGACSNNCTYTMGTLHRPVKCRQADLLQRLAQRLVALSGLHQLAELAHCGR